MPQTLLLADDSVTIQRVIELTFADEDINVVAVSDGDQAIARLDTMPPDIVLVDVGMPGKSGYDVAGHIKHTPHLSHIPVVLLTGAFEPVDEVKANAIGCDGILAKPFEPQIVISRVKELLARPTSEAPAAAPFSSLDAFAPEMNGAAPVIPPAPAANGDAVAKLDEYFDQLDSAFARFTSQQSARPDDLVLPVVEDKTPADLDWFGPPRSTEPQPFDTSLSLQETAPLPSGLQLPDSADLVREIHALEPPTLVNEFTTAPEPVFVPEPAFVPAPVIAPEPMFTSEPVFATQPMAASAPVFVPEPAFVPELTLSPEPVGLSEAVVVMKALASPEPVPAPAPISTPAPSAYTVAAAVPQASEPRALPSLTDAFAAILAAEQGAPSPSAWPPPQPPAPPAVIITDELIDRVAQRVIEQLTDRVVREAVAQAVSGIAERLVLEEIDRIKKALG